MTTWNGHYKIILPPNHTTIRRIESYNYTAPRISLLEDPYYQQLWLEILTEYKDTFANIVTRACNPVCIPIYKAHTLPQEEQTKLFEMIEALKSEHINFNFINYDFNKFEYKDPNLNQLLTNAKNIKEMDEAFFQMMMTNPHKLNLVSIHETMQDIEFQARHKSERINIPQEFLDKLKLLRKMYYKDNLRKPLTHTAYKIIQQLLFKDFGLTNNLIITVNSENLYKAFCDRPEYDPLCQKYGKSEMEYILNNYMR